MAETSFVEVNVRFYHSKSSPIELRRQVFEILKNIVPTDQEIEVEIGQHTGKCNTEFCDQTEEGWH